MWRQWVIAYLECNKADQYTSGEKEDGDDQPYDTPNYMHASGTVFDGQDTKNTSRREAAANPRECGCI